MKYLSFLIIFSVIIQISAFTQNSISSKEIPLYRLKRNQHTISYSPLAYLGYKYAHSFEPALTFGIGLSLGARFSEIPRYFEMAKFNFFYRIFITDKTYLNLGLFASLMNEFQPYRGFESEIFYGWNHFKIGQGVQYGIFTDEMSDHGGDENLFILNLLILQVNL